jgi:hypothetical protein
VKIGRPTKAQLYKKQREEVLHQMCDILDIDIDKDGAFFYLDDIDDDMQEKILKLDEDVKRFFIFSNWPFFKKGNDDRSYLSLMKSILKDMGYSAKKYHSFVTKNGVKTKKTKFCIEKNN